jgi:ABC-type Mn2+/Zn2+ transport system permease subunit
MSRLTLFGIIAALLGVIAYFTGCPYGVAIMAIGGVLFLIGLITRGSGRTMSDS